MKRRIEIKKLNKDAILPDYAHEGDAGFDLYSCEDVKIEANKWKMVHTGLQIKLPKGTEGQVRSKSGVAFRSGVFVLNSPGTVDENYEGEICVVLMNLSENEFSIKKGQKIAQMVINNVVYCNIQEVSNIKSSSARGRGGFGSSGLTKNKI